MKLSTILNRYAQPGDDLETALCINDDSTADELAACADWLDGPDADDAIDSSGRWAVKLSRAGLSDDLRRLAKAIGG